MATRSPTGRRSSSSRAVEPPEVAEFADFCAELTLDNGRRFVLEPFQRRMLHDYFAGAIETLILISKKNGKTTLMAALALYHLLTTVDAECVIGAAAREQAEIMLRQIRGFIHKSEDLLRLMDVNRREVRMNDGEGRIRIMSSDADTGDGVIPTLALVDELHRHKNSDLYGVFRDGLGPRDGQIITISTAGDDEDSALGQMRARAYALPTFEKAGTYRYARSGNGAFAMHEWALEPDENRDDVAVVKTANPASWHTLEKLQIRRDSPTTTEWQWARFACGVWLQGENRVISPVEWAQCAAREPLGPPEGAVVRIGLDLGFSGDTTGIVVHWFDDDVACLGAARILTPPRSRGVSLRKREVLEVLAALRDEYAANEVVCDPSRNAEVFADDLEDAGFEVVGHSQQPGPMAQAAERFYSAIREGKLRHPADPAFTRHVLNAVKRSTVEGAWAFVKESKSSEKHIDALIAAAMVHNYAVDELQAVEPLLEVFG